MHLLGLLTFTNLVATSGYSAVFVLCVLQSCCVPTSSELTLGFAGVLAAQGKLSLPGVVAVGVLGEVVGACIAWAVGRYAGRAAVDRFGRYVLLSHHDLDRAEAWYDRHQRFGVFGSRLLPVIRNFAALPAGIAEVPLTRFAILTAAGSLLWDGAWAGIGYGVGAHWHTIASGFSDIGYVLAVVAVAAIAFAIYHRYRSYQAATSGEPVGRHAGLPTSGPGYVGDKSTVGTVGAVRWIGGSSGQPPADRPAAREAGPDRPNARGAGPGNLATREDGPDRLVASSSRRSAAHARRSDFSSSPVAAWEAAVLHGRMEPRRAPAHVRRSDFSSSPVAAWEAAVLRGRTDTDPRVEPLVDEGDVGVEANGRLTAMLGALLLVLLAVEGVTLLRISALVTVHVVIGMVLVPVVLLKIGSATWRFARYYLGSPAYRRKGPPPAMLRLLGPFVVVSTVAVVGSGIALLLAPSSFRNELLLIHKVTFVLWFAAMVVHVLGHFLDVAQLAPRDFYRRTKGQVRGASTRQWVIVTAVCIGILLAVAVAPKVGPWLAQGVTAHKAVGARTIVTPSSSPHRHL